jgi:hypothetical protein
MPPPGPVSIVPCARLLTTLGRRRFDLHVGLGTLSLRRRSDRYVAQASETGTSFATCNVVHDGPAPMAVICLLCSLAVALWRSLTIDTAVRAPACLTWASPKSTFHGTRFDGLRDGSSANRREPSGSSGTIRPGTSAYPLTVAIRTPLRR